MRRRRARHGARLPRPLGAARGAARGMRRQPRRQQGRQPAARRARPRPRRARLPQGAAASWPSCRCPRSCSGTSTTSSCSRASRTGGVAQRSGARPPQGRLRRSSTPAFTGVVLTFERGPEFKPGGDAALGAALARAVPRGHAPARSRSRSCSASLLVLPGLRAAVAAWAGSSTRCWSRTMGGVAGAAAARASAIAAVARSALAGDPGAPADGHVRRAAARGLAALLRPRAVAADGVLRAALGGRDRLARGPERARGRDRLERPRLPGAQPAHRELLPRPHGAARSRAHAHRRRLPRARALRLARARASAPRRSRSSSRCAPASSRARPPAGSPTSRASRPRGQEHGALHALDRPAGPAPQRLDPARSAWRSRWARCRRCSRSWRTSPCWASAPMRIIEGSFTVGNLVAFQVLLAGFTAPVHALFARRSSCRRCAATSRAWTTCCTTRTSRA